MPSFKRFGCVFKILFLLTALSLSSLILHTVGAQVNITATKTDNLVDDGDNDGEADPGDTIEYTIVITSNGNAASNVQFSDTLDSNTTLVNLIGNDFRTTPLARNDGPYAVVGNVGISVADGSSDLLANDNDPDGTGAVTLVEINGCGDTTAPFVCPTSTTQGGDVTLNANGSFTYDPAPGFEGDDTFTYTVQDVDGNQDSATVSLTVSRMIWFVDVTAAGGGDGRLNSPYNCLVGANCFDDATDEAGDHIFVADGSYTCGLTLLDTQRLIGDGSSSTLTAVTGVTVPPHSNPLPTFSGTNPVLTSTNIDCITLAAGNTVQGLTVGNTGTGVGLADSGSVGTLTISEVSITGTGGGFEADNGGTLNVSLDELSASSTGSNEAIHIVAGGAFTVTTGTISTNGVQAINIDGDTTLALNVSLTSVSAQNTATGILVQDTTGSFTVNGTGTTDGSGGTIQDITQRGASFINTQNITLKNMTFDDASTTDSASNCQQTPSILSSGCFAAIHLDSSQTINLDNINITDTAQHAISGNNVTTFSLKNSTALECGDEAGEDCLFFVNLDGTVTIENSDLAFPRSRPVYIHNTDKHLSLTVTGSTFRDNQLIFGTSSENTAGEDGMLVDINGSSNNTINISNSNFLRIRTQAPQIVVRNSSVADVTITGSTFDVGTGSFNIGRGPELLAEDTTQLTFDIANNPKIISNGGRAILVAGVDSASIDGHIRNNTDIQGSNNAGGAILVKTEGNATGVVNVEGNTASNANDFAFILAQSRLGSGDLNMTINNNTLNGSVVTGIGQVGISVQTVNSNTMCANIINNHVTLGSGGSIGHGTLNFDEGGGNIELQGFTGSLDTTWNNNGNTVQNNTFLTAGTPSAPVSACTTPSIAMAQPEPTEMFAQQDAPVALDQIPTSLVAFTTLVEPVDDGQRTTDDRPPPTADRRPLTDDQPLVSHLPSPISYLRSRSAGLASPLQQGETINVTLGAMDTNQEVTITLQATINDPQNPATNDQVCNQGTVTADGGINVDTDDPDTGTANDETCTALESGTIIIQKDQDPNGSNNFGFSSNIPGNTTFNVSEGSPQTFTDVPPGQYTVTENDPTPQTFTLTGLTCDDDASDAVSVENVGTRTAMVNLEPGETVTCTYTNEQSSSIFVEKVVVGSPPATRWEFSGIGGIGNFTLPASGGNILFINQASGSYMISETLSSNYNTTAACDNGASGSSSVAFTLQAGQDVTCTFTNTRKTGQLTVVKEVSPVSDPGLFNLEIDGNDEATDVGHGGSSGSVTVETGLHTVGETAGSGTSLDDYGSNIVCRTEGGTGNLVADSNDTGPLNVPVAENDDILCTIRNIKNPGQIVIIKETLQPHPQNFTFTTSLPIGNFILDDPATDDGDAVTNTITYNVVPDTTYIVTEDDPTASRFDLTGLSCIEDDLQNSTVNLGTRTATLTVEANETVTCVFTNTAQSGKIIITKVATPADGTDFGFTSTLPGRGTFSLDDDVPDDGDGVSSSLTVTGLDFGAYTVTEDDPGKFSLNRITCDDTNSPTPSTIDLNSRTATLNLDPGETINCTFTNQQDSIFIYLPIIIK